MEFQYLLDHSWWSRWRSAFCHYLAAVNSVSGTPPVLYWLRIIVSFIQLVGPSLFLSSTVLWTDSAVNDLVHGVGVLWHSWRTEMARIYTSISFFFLIVLLIAQDHVQMVLYRRMGRVSIANGRLQNGIMKCVRPILLPLLVCGVVPAVNRLAGGAQQRRRARCVASSGREDDEHGHHRKLALAEPRGLHEPPASRYDVREQLHQERRLSIPG